MQSVLRRHSSRLAHYGHFARQPRLVRTIWSAPSSLRTRDRNGVALGGIFGLSLPTPSNEPLAGTDGSSPPWLFFLQVFLGLPTLLWFYKCVVMVVFQRRIIYLPSVPPGSRNKAMTDSLASGMAWRAVKIETKGKTRYTRQAVKLRGLELRTLNPVEGTPKVVVIYLQGNAGTPLHRLPLFQRLLSPTPTSPHVTILAVAPRSFWLSTRTAPTERGVLGDYTAVFEYAREKYGDDTKIVLYGHSLGGAVALSLCRFDSIRSRIAGCILENPLPSIPHMVRSFYPQRWLPYHYLGPFVFDRWDSISAIRDDKALRDVPSLWIRSGSDEIIPDGGVEAMYASVEGEGKRWVGVKGALHDTAYLTREWKRAMDQFLADVTRVNS